MLIHIHVGDDDEGIHAHQHGLDDNFYISALYGGYSDETLRIRRLVFSPNRVVHNVKLIDLSKIAILEDKMNQITEEYE